MVGEIQGVADLYIHLCNAIDEALVDPENLGTQALGRYSILSNNVSQVQEELRNNSFTALTAAYKYSRKLNLLRARLTAKSSLSLSGFMRQRTGFLSGPESNQNMCTIIINKYCLIFSQLLG